MVSNFKVYKKIWKNERKYNEITDIITDLQNLPTLITVIIGKHLSITTKTPLSTQVSMGHTVHEK